MTALERARRFLEDKGRKLALTAAPLAALAAITAPPAHAGTLAMSYGSCMVGPEYAQVTGS